MEINEMIKIILENRERALIYAITFFLVILITMIFVPGIIGKIKFHINGRNEPGRITMEWELVNNDSYAYPVERINYFDDDNTNEDDYQYDVSRYDEIQFESDTVIPDELFNDDLTMSNLDTEHQKWAMDESIKSVTPFECGGYDMNNGNSFNDDFFTNPSDDLFDDFSNPDPFGF